MFDSVLSDAVGTLSITSALLCMGVSLLLGLFIAFIYMKSGRYNKNIVLSLTLLPLLVQTVVMMVNGNLGTSVAILGAFSLTRFRSVPATSRELISVFFAMSIGLVTGMGYVTYAIIFAIFTGSAIIILSYKKFGELKDKHKILKITIPEDLNYNNIFNDIFEKYIKTYELINTKTTNMGSLYALTYNVVLKNNVNEKDLIDELRCRNGNLEILLKKDEEIQNEL